MSTYDNPSANSSQPINVYTLKEYKGPRFSLAEGRNLWTTGVFPPLPCLKGNNSPGPFNPSPPLSSYRQKAAFSFEENAIRFIEKHGILHVGFLTLTFPDKVYDITEANRRWNSLNNHFIREYFGEWIKVNERHKDGSWHFHLLIALKHKMDIRTGFDFEAVKGRDYRSACPYLRKGLWPLLRTNLEKYGFGRHELLPIKKSGDAVAKYLAKYLSKSWTAAEETGHSIKGIRLVSYSFGQLRGNSKFSWISENAKKWRRNLGHFAALCGISDIQGMMETFGSHWAYFLGGIIKSFDDTLNKMALGPDQPGQVDMTAQRGQPDPVERYSFWNLRKEGLIPEAHLIAKRRIVETLERLLGIPILSD